MKKITEGDISTRVLKFLFHYRITPTSTGLSPAEMLNKRRLRSRLDLVYPNVHKQEYRNIENTLENRPRGNREFSGGDQVFIEDFRGNRSRWIPGEVTGAQECIVHVQTSDGLLCRHRDHVRKRHEEIEQREASGLTEPVVQDKLVPTPPVPTQVELTPEASHNQEETMVQKAAVPCSPVHIPVMRRSQRERKTPNRLDL